MTDSNLNSSSFTRNEFNVNANFENVGDSGSVEKSFAAATAPKKINEITGLPVKSTVEPINTGLEFDEKGNLLQDFGFDNSNFTQSKLGRGILGKKRKLTERKVPPNLRYPDAEIYGDTDYLQIRIVKYKTVREVSGNTIVGKPGSRRNSAKESLGTILLPVPPSIQDANLVNYQGSNMNSITAAAVTGAEEVMKAGKGAASDPLQALQNIINKGGAAITNTVNAAGRGATIIDLLTKSLASQAVGVFGGNVTVDQLLARNDGIIFNPNMELLFNGPSLRNFAFAFKMTPRSKTEGDKVKEIIRTFKFYMAPQVTAEGDGNLFLKTPNIFELSYMQGGGAHPFLNKFKQCFLSNVSVNYTGEGTYATYGDGTPISLVMTLQFQEIEPIYDIDYIDDKDKFIGGVGY